MNEFFGTIYDTLFGIFNNLYFLIFQHLYDNGGYVKLGLSFILIPLVCWLLFYYLWKYPYGKLWHWLVWMAVTVLIVFGATYGIANTEILGSDNQAVNKADYQREQAGGQGILQRQGGGVVAIARACICNCFI